MKKKTTRTHQSVLPLIHTPIETCIFIFVGAT